MVNAKVAKRFEDAYFTRLLSVYERSSEAQSLTKRRMYLDFKKFLIRSRIVTFGSEQTDR